jgi:carbon-monoxide dehydrogenase medium subunit
MKPAPFHYHAPRTIEDVLALLSRNPGEARILAGGQSLVPLMNMRLATPGILVDINHITNLGYIQPWNDGLAIGALTRDSALERDPEAARRLPLLVEASRYVGHPAIRNRSTVGGSIAHADPAAELPAVLLALDGEILARSPSGSRVIAAPDFFLGHLQTALGPDELLIEVRMRGLPAGAGSTFIEFARREGDYALAGVAAAVALAADGTISDARLALCAVGPTALRARDAEAALRGQRPGPEAWAAAAERVVAAITEPPSDIHGSADYRRHLAGVLTRRALAAAAERATAA